MNNLKQKNQVAKKSQFASSIAPFFVSIIALFAFFALFASPIFAQKRTRKISGGVPIKNRASKPKKEADEKPLGESVGVPTTGEKGVQKTTGDVMTEQLFAPPSQRPLLLPEREKGEDEYLPQDPNASATATFPKKKTDSRKKTLNQAKRRQ